MNTVCQFLLISIIALVAMTSTAQAGVVDFSLTHEFSGATAPAGVLPWMTIQFDDSPGAGKVAIRIDLSGLTDDEFVSQLYLNLKTDFSVADLMLTPMEPGGVFAPPTINQAPMPSKLAAMATTMCC